MPASLNTRASRVRANRWWAYNTSTRAQKDGALEAMAQALLDSADRVLAANAADVATAEETDTPAHLVDRLRLDRDRVASMARGLRNVAGLPDPVGEVLRGSTLPTASSCARCGCRSAWSA